MKNKIRGTLFVITASIFTLAFVIGGIFFLNPPFDLSTKQFIILGSVTVLMGAMISSVEFEARWIVSFIIVGIGAYFLARGTELITSPWLSWTIGVAFFGASAMLCYSIAKEITDRPR